MMSKRLVTIFCLAVFFCCCSTVSLWAAVSISPAIVRLSLDKKRPTGQFIIRNVGDTTERYRINAKHFTYSESGALQIVKPDKHSLAPWIKFNPKEFTLPPKSRRTVRFVIVPKGNLVPKQEYWASMELDSLKENMSKTVDDGQGRSMTVKVKAVILVPIFATKGEINYSGATLEDVKIVVGQKADKRIQALVNNPSAGSLLVTMRYKIIDSAGQVVKENMFGKGYVLAKSKRIFKRIIESDEIPKGEYTVEVKCSDSHLSEPLNSTIQYTW